MKKQNRLLRVLARLNGKEKNMTDVLNVIATRPSNGRFGEIATRPSQQQALPRFLRRSDRSSLRNPNR